VTFGTGTSRTDAFINAQGGNQSAGSVFIDWTQTTCVLNASSVPIVGATVTFTDAFSTQYTGTTASNGCVPVPVTQYRLNNDTGAYNGVAPSLENHNPYSRSVSATGFTTNTQSGLTFTAAGPSNVTLTAGANPLATLSPNLNFGNQNINTTSSGLATIITNTGSLPVVVSQSQLFGTNFTLTNLGTCFTTFLSNTSFTLQVGQSCTFVITFSPTATTTYSGSFQVTDNALGSPQVITLGGTGTVPIIAWSSPQGGTTYNYGNVLTGSFSDSSALTLSNTGTGPLNVALTITGTNAAQFVVQSTTCSNVLQAGNNCTVVVRFTPIAAQSYAASLTETDSVQSLTADLTLSGAGINPPVQKIAPAPWMVIAGRK
jgi:hypothetical protein